MKIVPLAIALIATLLLIPFFSWYFGTPLNAETQQALWALIAIATAAATYCFALGEITGNNSQVDKLWSLMPIAYSWVVAAFGDFSNRLVLMSLLVTAWGLRLSFNFWLKGGYQWKFWQGEEDYRWSVLRKRPEFQPAWKWTLFNLFFISGYQNALILMFTLPIVVALQFNSCYLTPLDWLAAALMAFFIAYESIADWQQWRFQSNKRVRERSGPATEQNELPGFLDKGLWAWSRHPNYFAEQAIWISFYLFSVAASQQWFNWSVAGCLMLVLLFQGSTQFSEEITAGKYPGYASYQKTVPRFIPWFPSRHSR